MIQMLTLLEMFQSLLFSPCFFKIFFLNFVLVVYFYFMFQIIDLNPSFPSLLVPCGFFFISLSVAFISSFMLLPYSMSSLSILITSVLDSASERLAIYISLSPFSRVLFCSFIWTTFLCLLDLAASLGLFLYIR